MPPTEDERDELSEVENCINLHQLQVNDSSELDIPQVIYVIYCSHHKSVKKSLESEEFCLFNTEVGFRLPKLFLPSRSRCAVINGFIYVLNKHDGDMDRYDPISNQLKKCKRLDRFGLKILLDMVNIQNELYVVDGFYENKLLKYDPIADKWTQRASLDKKRRGFACTVLNRMLYVVGGNDGCPSHPFAFVDRYDPINNKWTSVAPLLTSQRDLAVVTLGNYIYAIGGSTYKGGLKTVERYDVFNDKWEFVASMKYGRASPKAVVFNKKIYVFGGFRGLVCDFVEIVECYDEETNEWKEVARMSKHNYLVIFSQVIVSYQPCVSDICENFPF